MPRPRNTKCSNGHLRTPDNYYIAPKTGQIMCLSCRLTIAKKHRENRRAIREKIKQRTYPANFEEIKKRLRPIKGYEREYSITKDGLIFSHRSLLILKTSLNKLGYPQITLSKDGARKCFRIHRLIADTWLEPVEGKTEVNHKNGVKTDNYVENLEWATRSENIKHAWDTGLLKKTNQNVQKAQEVVKCT